VKRTTSVQKMQRRNAEKRQPAPRWALAADGAFVLLGTPTEIPAPAARALVAFIRQLDQGEA
jgi:hypothetical protein